jgi:hypothetical protein
MLALSRRIPRPSVALVVAFAALFTALGGTGYAALKITGKNVANSSLTGLDVKNKSLGPQELKPDSLGGAQINESILGIVPSAQHAATADVATKALDADKVGGIPAAELMTQKTRAYEATILAVNNFPNGSTLASLPNLPAGTYVVTARLNYHNPGAVGAESCTLQVPGSDDISSFTVGAGETETVSLQEVVSSGSVFMPTVSCTSDGSDDIVGNGSLIALRVD